MHALLYSMQLWL